MRAIHAGYLIGLAVLCTAGGTGGPAAPAGRTNAAKPRTEASLAPGQTSTEIKAPGSEWSYFVYLPKAYTPNRKWPILFVMSPGGGDAGTLGGYIPAAEMNNWILAISVQSRNSFSGCEAAVTAMLNDACHLLPIDPKRLYASGYSGGARVAFGLAEQMRVKGFAGLLLCGAGGHAERLSPKTVLFGLCGSNCFNRWDMTITFKDAKNDQSRLRFYVGGHDWGSPEMLQYGVAWLNARFFKNIPPNNPALTEERKQLIAKIKEQIAKDTPEDVEKAYEWALCLAALAPSNIAPETQPLQALLKNPKVQRYAAGLKEMDAFVKRRFGVDRMDYKNNNGTPAAKRDADRLAEKYADTGLASLFTRLGEPSPLP